MIFVINLCSIAQRLKSFIVESNGKKCLDLYSIYFFRVVPPLDMQYHSISIPFYRISLSYVLCVLSIYVVNVVDVVVYYFIIECLFYTFTI